MVEVRERRHGIGWEIWVNGIHVYGTNNLELAYDIANSIYNLELWPTAE